MNFQALLAHLKPHRTVPVTPWRANNRWDLSVGRVGILFSGLLLFGFGDALVVQSNLGNAPWTIFAEGVSKKTSLSLGVSTLVISAAVMLLWIPLKEVPGFGTFANAILIAFGIQFGVDYFPRTRGVSTLSSPSVIMKILREARSLRREIRGITPVV